MVRFKDTLIRKARSQDSAEHRSAPVQGLAAAVSAARRRVHGDASVRASTVTRRQSAEPAGAAAGSPASIVRPEVHAAAASEVIVGPQVLLLTHAATAPGGAVSKVARTDRDLLRKSSLPLWLTRSDTLPRHIGVALHPDALGGDHARRNRQFRRLRPSCLPGTRRAEG